MFRTLTLITIVLLSMYHPTKACSVVYYIDKISGKIYVGNNEDYWYNTKAYIQIEPSNDKQLARLWYGWDNFAQGGINQAGLFFDGAVTPEQPKTQNLKKIKGNFGDRLLASCTTVQQAIAYIKEEGIALNNAHMMLGDSTGDAAVLEWLNEKLVVTPIKNNRLTMTNFLLSDTALGNYPCYRYNAINKYLDKIETSQDNISFLKFSNALAQAAQTPKKIEDEKVGGTLYSTFINISDMEFVLVYKLDNSKVTKLNLVDEFTKKKSRRIKLSSKSK